MIIVLVKYFNDKLSWELDESSFLRYNKIFSDGRKGLIMRLIIKELVTNKLSRLD